MTDVEKQLENDQDPVQTEQLPAEPVLAEPILDEVGMEDTGESPDTPEAANRAGVEEYLVVESETIPMSETLTSEVGETAEPSVASHAAETPEISDTLMAEMTQTIESLKAQLEDRNSQYMRIAADFDNFRRRTLKEKEELEQKVKCTTISELLPVVDNFERARVQLKPQTDADMNIHKSYQSVYKQLVDCLKRIGVAPMHAKGKLFDPSFHEAVVREPSKEEEDGTVLEELVRGYLLGERVLRHALVKVAVAVDETSPAPVEATDP